MPITTLKHTAAAVNRHYPGLLGTVEAVLSVFGAMCLSNRTKPLSLILEGDSGTGKTAALQMAFPYPGSELANYAYRSDKFSPRSFVTHAANKKRSELGKLDLLPRLQDKVLLSKELAPIFRGREEELQDVFSILISVLDGKGLSTDSGTQGQRGYQQNIIFNWVGATTPLPDSTHRLMSQLGTRLLFYEVPRLDLSHEELLDYARNDETGTAETECQTLVGQFLTNHFTDYPVGSITPDCIEFTDEQLEQLVRWSTLLVTGRAEVKCEKEKTNWIPIAAKSPEGPHKVIGYLKELARGHAIIYRRDHITDADIEFVGKVAVSSIPGHLRPIIRALMSNPRVYTPTAVGICRVTGPTARRYFKELELLKIGKIDKGDSRSGEPDSLVLHRQFKWLNPKLD